MEDKVTRKREKKKSSIQLIRQFQLRSLLREVIAELLKL